MFYFCIICFLFYFIDVNVYNSYTNTEIHFIYSKLTYIYGEILVHIILSFLQIKLTNLYFYKYRFMEVYKI